MESHKAAKPFVWIQSEDGTTYLCPKDEVQDAQSYGKLELEKYCINESTVPPWND